MRAPCTRRLDAVAHRVLHQRLQHQRRHARAADARVDVPADLQPLAVADLLDRQVALRQVDLLVQRDRVAGIGQRHAEQLRQVLEHALGARRVDAHQRQRGVQRVEQEVRPDARLQFGQPHAGVHRLPQPRTQLQPGPGCAGQRRAGQRHAQQVQAAAGVGQARPTTAATRRSAPPAAPSASRLPTRAAAGRRASGALQRAHRHQPQQRAGDADEHGARTAAPASRPAGRRRAAARRAPAPPARPARRASASMALQTSSAAPARVAGARLVRRAAGRSAWARRRSSSARPAACSPATGWPAACRRRPGRCPTGRASARGRRTASGRRGGASAELGRPGVFLTGVRDMARR